MMNEFA